jgi:hypothetical protein
VTALGTQDFVRGSGVGSFYVGARALYFESCRLLVQIPGQGLKILDFGRIKNLISC